jgi:hypothetical protein
MVGWPSGTLQNQQALREQAGTLHFNQVPLGTPVWNFCHPRSVYGPWALVRLQSPGPTRTRWLTHGLNLRKTLESGPLHLPCVLETQVSLPAHSVYVGTLCRVGPETFQF